LPVSPASSASARTPVSMLRGARLRFALALIGPSASHAPKRPSAEGTIVTSPASAARGQDRAMSTAASASSAPRDGPLSGSVSLRVQRLREHARSILEHHLNLLAIDHPHDVSVTKLAVPNQLAENEGLRC